MHRFPSQDFDGINNRQIQLHMSNIWILGEKNAQSISTLIWKLINFLLLSSCMPWNIWIFLKNIYPYLITRPCSTISLNFKNKRTKNIICKYGWKVLPHWWFFKLKITSHMTSSNWCQTCPLLNLNWKKWKKKVWIGPPFLSKFVITT